MVQLVITTTSFSGFSFTHPFGVRERERERLVKSGPQGREGKKRALYLSVNVFSTKVLIHRGH